MLYSSPPRIGEEGTVKPVAHVGGKRTSMPGPGGGLLYVEWSDGYFQGVSPRDLQVLPKRKQGAAACVRCLRKHHQKGDLCAACKTGRANPSKRTNYNASVPKTSIDWLLGRINVGTPDAEVAADIRRRSEKAGASEPQVKANVAYAIKQHHANIEMYNSVMMSGRIGRGRANPRRRRSRRSPGNR